MARKGKGAGVARTLRGAKEQEKLSFCEAAQEKEQKKAGKGHMQISPVRQVKRRGPAFAFVGQAAGRIEKERHKRAQGA